jgi:hypothetical protein
MSIKIEEREASIRQLQEVGHLLSFYAGQTARATAETQELFTQTLGSDFVACHDPLKQLEQFLSLAARAERGEIVPSLEGQVAELNQKIGETRVLAEEMNAKIDAMDAVITKLEALVQAKEATL